MRQLACDSCGAVTTARPGDLLIDYPYHLRARLQQWEFCSLTCLRDWTLAQTTDTDTRDSTPAPLFLGA